MRKLLVSLMFLLAGGMGTALQAQSLFPDFSKLHFGCDGNSITAGEQWSKTVVDLLGFATHHNVAVGSATWACHPDTQDYGSECRCATTTWPRCTSRSSSPR